MKSTWNGAVMAQSDDTVLVEGNDDFPESSLTREFITFSNHRTSCAGKGQAHYDSLLVNGEMNTNAVCYHPDPTPEAGMVRGRVAFWNGVAVA